MPFAKRFFAELTTILLDENQDFIALVKDFFQDFRGNIMPIHPDTSVRYVDLYPKNHEWTYTDIPKPADRNISNPFIQFLLNPCSSKIMDEYSKLLYLEDAAGFLVPDSKKKLNEIFYVSPTLLFTSTPNIKTIASLKQLNEKDYFDIVLAIEAERLAYENEQTINIDEYIVLESFKNKVAFEDKYLSNINDFFRTLKCKRLQHYFSVGHCVELINLYRLAQTHNLLQGEPEIINEAHHKIKSLIPTLDLDKQCEIIFTLFKPGVNTGHIADPDFRQWLVERLTTGLAEQLKSDDNTPFYFQQVKAVAKRIEEDTIGIIQLDILDALATKINAQKEVAFLLRDIYQSHSLSEALKQSFTGIVTELLLNEAAEDAGLAQHILNFLANPLTQDSARSLHKYLQSKYAYKLISKIDHIVENEIQNYHKNFSAMPFKIKLIILDPLLFPLNMAENQQLTTIQKLIDEAFPTQIHANLSTKCIDQNRNAKTIINAYLDVAELSERRLLTSALFVANITEDVAIKSTNGQKLTKILTHLGPAGGKLLQAIHSHPQTPEDIKRDLVSSKMKFDPPSRWEVIERIVDSGLLVASNDNKYPITHIGELVGSGSFGLTTFNTTNGTLVSDTFLRKNVAITSERELTQMEKAADKLAQLKSEFKPLKDIIDEAKHSARRETNMELAKKANQLAEKSYHGVSVRCGSYSFTHIVTQLKKTGKNYKRTTIAPGKHFNELDDGPFKTSVAKAMFTTQLHLRLTARHTDLDRHGGNVKIEGNCITHFDFGAMNITPITQEDLMVTGTVIAKTLLRVLLRGQDLSQALLTAIQTTPASEQARSHLSGLSKDVLSMGDYINNIDKKELEALIAKCLTEKTVAPQLIQSFKKELRWFAPLVIKTLEAKAKNTNTTVFLKVSPLTTHSFMQPIKAPTAKNKTGALTLLTIGSMGLGCFFMKERLFSPTEESNRKSPKLQ